MAALVVGLEIAAVLGEMIEALLGEEMIPALFVLLVLIGYLYAA